MSDGSTVLCPTVSVCNKDLAFKGLEANKMVRKKMCMLLGLVPWVGYKDLQGGGGEMIPRGCPLTCGLPHKLINTCNKIFKNKF